MSDDVINANPTVLDISELPKRFEDTKGYQKENPLLDDIASLSLLPSSKVSNFEDDDIIPDLMTDSSDGDMASETSDMEEVVSTEVEEAIDSQEIFDLIATISDPEHPLTLGQLAVVNLPDIFVKNGKDKQNDISEVLVKITPTITHCSLATLIGLGIRVRLDRCLPPRFRIRILVKEGTHQSENQVNKQLNDKERVAAACENEQLLGVILQMLSSCI